MKLTTLSSAITLLITSGLIMGCNSEATNGSSFSPIESPESNNIQPLITERYSLPQAIPYGQEIVINSSALAEDIGKEKITITNAEINSSEGILTDISLDSIALRFFAPGKHKVTISYFDETGQAGVSEISIDSAQITDKQYHRFLLQATFGPTVSDLSTRKVINLSKWIDHQMKIPASSHQQMTKEFGGRREDRADAWYQIALKGEDQLRQRIAFALSQLFVVSQSSGLYNRVESLANYNDMLASHAFGNFRELLEDVSMHPAMAYYLTLLGSEKENERTGAQPDENYAREIMQLFTIGLNLINNDGSIILDDQGKPIETYVQEDVRNVAKAFSGWNTASGDSELLQQIVANESLHDTSEKHILGHTLPAGQTAEEDIAQVLDILFNHPNTPPFFAEQMIKRLVTSNPSPKYIERVANVFIDNGKSIRGDLGAVFKAILLDEEALGLNAEAAPIKVKEPLITILNLQRAMNVQFDKGIARGATNIYYTVDQGPLLAKSVFNFYSPDHIIKPSNKYAPEMEIISWPDYVDVYVYLRAFAMGYAYNMKPEYGYFANSTDNTELFVQQINTIFFGGDMPEPLLTQITEYVENNNRGGGIKNNIWLVRFILELVVSSDEFFIQD
ncbi:DUF1800 domain-containing protein [Vibrio sp. TRT 17S01]|uniref:DUF1800 domain-containing protein n=1 Tax=Vibrio sp. TRT 17S01 TaxID=3418505 RepID=UPI003CE9BA68